MARDTNAFELINLKARVAIHKSLQLIQQSKVLRLRTIALLNASENRPALPFHAPNPESAGNRNSALRWIVESALEVTGAPMANLQIFGPDNGALRIAVQHGFQSPFLEFFDRVHKGQAACGHALKNHSRIIIEDVTESAVFSGTPALEVLLDAGVRAVQSTPLISSSGVIHGVFSTHWSSPCRPGKQELLQLDSLARTVADWFEYASYA